MEKKGQFTILALFGLIALIVIGLVLYFASSLQGETSRQAAEEAVDQFIETNSLRSYVDSCLQSVGEQALFLAGWQGGNIWKYQNGTVELGDLGEDYSVRNFDGQEFDIPYVLKDIETARCPALNYKPGPYPHAEFDDSIAPFSSPDLPDEIQDLLDSLEGHESLEINDYNEDEFLGLCMFYPGEGFFGIRNTKRLCTYQGPNWKGDPDRPRLYSTCEGRYDYERRNPVQYQLSNYTENHLLKCADFERLQQVGGFDVEVVNQPRINYTFGREDVTISAVYPVRVSQEGRPPVVVNAEFVRVIDARFKELYEFFNDLVLKEARQPRFDPENDYEESALYREGFEVEFDRNCCGNDNLLIVEDSQSVVQGRTLTIQGLVENRWPVMGYIEIDPISVQEGQGVGISIPLSTNVYDPDEDAFSARFFGFKEGEWSFTPGGDATAWVRDEELPGCSYDEDLEICIPPNMPPVYTFVVVNDEGGSDFQYEGIFFRFNIFCSETCGEED